MRNDWTTHHRDALLRRVSLLTAVTAVTGAVGAAALAVGLAATSHAATTHTSASQATSGSSRSGSAAPAPTAPAVVSPRQVHVQVLNGTGVPGAAHAAAKDLTAAGFDVVGIGNAPDAPVTATSIAYAPGKTAEMQLLASATGVTTTVAGSGSLIVLTVGPDWAGSQPAPVTQSNGGGLNAPAQPPSNSGNGYGGGSASSGGS